MSDAMGMDFSQLGQVGKASLGTNLAGGALGGALDLANFIQNSIYAKKDRDFRDMVYNETKEREDNAVQRRIADMSKAGLSPLAEVGGAGSSAGGSSVSAPIVHANGSNPFSGAFTEATASELRSTSTEQNRIKNYKDSQHLSNLKDALEAEKAEFKNRTAEENLSKMKTLIEKEILSDPQYEAMFGENLKAMYQTFSLDKALKEANTWQDYIDIGIKFLDFLMSMSERAGAFDNPKSKRR